MNTWIITTGSSDILLKETKWIHDFNKIKSSDCYGLSFQPQKSDKHSLANNSSSSYLVPSRVLGLVYEKANDDYFNNLFFPLLDNLTDHLQKEQILIHRIIVLLTDQENVFDEDKRQNKNCPYWQDTIKNENIYQKYFYDKYNGNIEIKFCPLSPQETDNGLDNWNRVLDLVDSALDTVNFTDSETFYLSHQAGTPAISSALQFIALSRFEHRVNFLVSNEYTKKVNIIEGSEYLKRLQLQKAKRLITNGFPGSALQLLDDIYKYDSKQIKSDLKKLVDVFNIKNISVPDEFEPKEAIKRVRESLDLIEYFFKQKNYIQGIVLLAAAQETFLKASILINIKDKDPQSPVSWDKKGLHLYNKTYKYIKELFNKLKEITQTNDKDYWTLLTYSSDNYIRNQLMHNLRGVKKEEVILYLTDPDKLETYWNDPQNYSHPQINLTNTVELVYKNEIKDKFINVLEKSTAWNESSYEPLESRLQQVADSL